MSVRIIIAGVSQCDIFAEICLVADYLSQHLPNFCFDRIEKPVLNWEAWLCKINVKNKWHHLGSPIVWKEVLMKGSKPYYIGGAAQFLEYCHTYYNFDAFISLTKFEGLIKNFSQYKRKIKDDTSTIEELKTKFEVEEDPIKNNFVVCISGASCPLTMHLISGLLEMSEGEKSLSKIYLHDSKCSPEFMEYVEHECAFVGTKHPGKVVKYIEKIGTGLTHSDLLIILDHVPFDEKMKMGNWLHDNAHLMHEMSVVIKASASRNMYILFPNIGPACYNATVLWNSISGKNNIVVATSDLGLEVLNPVTEIAQVPLRHIFCPPVWGFVGINHLVDIRTTIHKYNSFDPYNRYVKVKNSTLNIGSVTPELRTLEYLMYFDDTLWLKVAANKKNIQDHIPIKKALATLDVVKAWLFDQNPDYILSLGIPCDGSFGLNFDGIFSQPARFDGRRWKPASDYLMPRDAQMKLPYLQYIAETMMTLKKEELPPIIYCRPCSCKTKYYKRKGVW